MKGCTARTTGPKIPSLRAHGAKVCTSTVVRAAAVPNLDTLQSNEANRRRILLAGTAALGLLNTKGKCLAFLLSRTYLLQNLTSGIHI